MNQKKTFTWEITGFVFISLLGSFLHFAFDLFGEWPPVAVIADDCRFFAVDLSSPALSSLL